jgi:hypothetical protein
LFFARAWLLCNVKNNPDQYWPGLFILRTFATKMLSWLLSSCRSSETLRESAKTIGPQNKNHQSNRERNRAFEIARKRLYNRGEVSGWKVFP